ncbi:chloride channel protein [Entomobacter blattae]|uniref:Voltage-gated ClC-type chloride channel ClcB n=1 Tax=Entomobacter blattae TaxID=2762277 RepID=A0A7H1NR07_9PROT|nr:chloride channel protein [Entomobacter blattae]QNT78217.1 Voltage-gated ClC-type chloride channel ClcB [Entomobacter blattae]
MVLSFYLCRSFLILQLLFCSFYFESVVADGGASSRVQLLFVQFWLQVPCTIRLTPYYYDTPVMTPQIFPLYSYFSLIGLGLVTALVGILVMWSVTVSKNIFRKIPVPGFIRPMIGGAIVGSLGTLTPAVLSSGHAALRIGLDGGFLFTTALLVWVLKTLAVSFSIEPSFRMGLTFVGAFFTSLFLGVLTASFPPHTSTHSRITLNLFPAAKECLVPLKK